VFVGRATERQALERLLAGARLGTSGALVVAGEPGVGKTALVEGVLAAGVDARVLRATGLEAEQEVPFGALLQLLRPALGLIDTIPRAQAEALSAALLLEGAPPTGGGDRFTIGAAVLALVCRYAEDGPVVVVVDDLHLLDAPSTDALLFAIRRLGADPVAVLATVRSPEGDALVADLPVLRLHGLDLDAAGELLTEGSPAAVSAERTALLHRATDGNPLALLELAALDDEALDAMSSGLPLRVPAVVTDAFARRLGRLDADCVSCLLVVAVCGGDLAVAADACARLEIDVARLADAEDAGLVTVRSGRVEFRHPLLRAATYSRAATSERRAAHRAVADALPATEVDRRAWHLSEAVWHPDADVSRLLQDAAQHAAARTAYSVASTAFERSARLSPDHEVRGELLLRAAENAWLAGQGDRALDLLDRHASGTYAAAGLPRELGLRATIAARTGSLRDALDLFLAAADEAQDADDAAVFVADAVHAAFYLGDARVAEVLAERQAALLPALSSPRARALGLMSTGIARVLAGRGGVREIRDAVPLLESVPDLRTDPRRWPWLLYAPLFLRDTTGGARLREVVGEVRDSAGVGSLPAVLFHVARDQATTEAWSQAEANYLEAIRLARDTGQATEEAMSLAGLAWLEARQGREDACREHAERARSLCSARDIHLGEAWASFALGDLELSLGRAQAAGHELRHLTDLLARQGLRDPDLFPGPELTEVLVRTGRRDEAEHLARDFLARAERKGQPWALARAHRGLGILADEADIDARFGDALDRHAHTLDRFETARTMQAYGERLRRAGRRVDARAQLRDALGIFDRLGARCWSDRAASELTATGETIRRTEAGSAAVLTPQELQVSLLLASGRTTREAAAALFLSPKTVEYHLRKVYTKLAVRSRADLAAALARITEAP
jgi:DNA-binding CsgD family transcriptional regulator